MNRVLISILLILTISFGFSQNGKILSKKSIDLRQEKFWNGISENDTLASKYQYLNYLNFYNIKYLSDSIVVDGYIIEPKREGKYPVVIFNRGGNRDFASLTIGTLINYCSELASNGYLIIGSDYRKKDEFGGKEINDVLTLTETVKEIEKADSNLIGMFGWSRGGMMTYLALQKSNKIIRQK